MLQNICGGPQKWGTLIVIVSLPEVLFANIIYALEFSDLNDLIHVAGPAFHFARNGFFHHKKRHGENLNSLCTGCNKKVDP